MHEAGLAQPGTMAAVLGLDDDQVDVACRRADEDVWIANYNAPGQVVIAGSPDGVAAATVHAKELGAKKVMALQVSGAFHTPFMTAARNQLRAAIAAADPRDTEVPVVANVDALPHHEGKEWASLLSAQLSSPVRWKYCLQELADLGVTDLAELGPGGVLTGMAKRTLDSARTISVATPEELDKLLEWVGRRLDGWADPHRGRAPLRPRAPRRQPWRRHLRPGAGDRRRRHHRRRHRARPRRPAGGALAVRGHAAELHRRRHRARHGPPTHRLAPNELKGVTMPAVRPGAKGAVISGWGTALPPKTLTNQDLADMGLATSDEWIIERTGIRQRQIGGTTAGLSAEAGRLAIGMSGLDPDSIDAIVLATTTPDRAVPATSATVANELGMRCGAFDVNAACSGFTYALVVAHGLIAQGAERLLVIGTDTLHRITDWEDRNTAVLFADGAGAIVLEAVDGGGQLLSWDLDADGSAERYLYAELGGYLVMDGKEVFRRAVRIMVDSAQKSLTAAGLGAGDVSLVVPHQANVRIIEAACNRLRIPMERAAIVLDRTGNTSSREHPAGARRCDRERSCPRG